MALLLSAEPIYSSTCYARMEGDTLCVGNSLIERTFQWNSGMLRTLSVVDKATGLSMASNGKGPDFMLAEGPAANAGLEVIDIPDGLVARVSFNIGGVRFRRTSTRESFSLSVMSRPGAVGRASSRYAAESEVFCSCIGKTHPKAKPECKYGCRQAAA